MPIPEGKGFVKGEFLNAGRKPDVVVPNTAAGQAVVFVHLCWSRVHGFAVGAAADPVLLQTYYREVRVHSRKDSQQILNVL